MKEKIVNLLIVLCVGFLIFLSFRIGFFSGLENFFEDLLFIERPFHSDIVIIAIDDESIKQIGQWPWKREIFADALLKLEEYKPKAVGIDVVFPEESRFGKQDDQILADTLTKLSYPIVLPIKTNSLFIEKDRAFANSFSGQLKSFEKQASIGHVNLILDSDGVVRRFPLFVEQKSPANFSQEQKKIPAFAFLLAKKAGLEIPNEKTLEQIPRIVFSAKPGTISRVPFYRLISGEIPDARLKNKILLIGSTAVDLHDEKPTPFSKGTQMQGVEIQANIVNMLVSGYQFKPLSFGYACLWIFFAAFLPYLIFIIFKSSFKSILTNVFLGGVWFVLMLFIVEEGTVPNLIHINAAWIFSTISLFCRRYFVGEKEKHEMKKAFSHYVSKEVLEEILRDPKNISLGGEEKFITILFSDIRGFTSVSEKLSPQKLVGMLNQYFNAMSGEILKHKGILDKYIGDAIMAFWGAPVPDENQADNAVQAAIGMVEQLENFNKKQKEKAEPEINIGIGIYSGLAVVGNVGSETRFDYTAIGDSVNIASRIEGLTKTYQTKIIISETVKEKLKGNYFLELLDSVPIRGRQEQVKIYKIEGVKIRS
ncbi:adenylate/guanylate cyclase domain-containing protein [Patescibacteria group bacterium]|nr:adenylate/guanylate cyclase domain-containing protein [Patescibacteria group bacterium]